MSLTLSASSTTWLKKKVSVSASSTKVIDNLPYAAFRFAHYIMRIENSTGSKAKSLNLEAQKVDNNLRDLVFGKFGNSVDVEITTKEVAGQFQLEIVNNETEDLDIRFARLVLD